MRIWASVDEYELPVNLVLLTVRLSCYLFRLLFFSIVHAFTLPLILPAQYYGYIFALCKGNPSQTWILDSILCQWNLDSGFQSLVGFRIHWAVFTIPKPRIPDSRIRNFPGSGIRIHFVWPSFVYFLAVHYYITPHWPRQSLPTFSPCDRMSQTSEEGTVIP